MPLGGPQPTLEDQEAIEVLRQEHLAQAEGAGWARAKVAIESLASLQSPDSRVEVGRVQFLARGLFRAAYVAELRVTPDPHGLSGPVVAKVPKEPTTVGVELRWVAQVRRCRLPFAVPRPLGASAAGVIVEEHVSGWPIERAQWRHCTDAAAALHALPMQAEVGRRTFAMESLEPLRTCDIPLVQEALAWCDHHVPDGPLVLIHGDLLPQNVLQSVEGRLTVIDWQFVGPGDPAYEIAVMTRGVRYPFKLSGGPEAVIEAYHEAGGVPITLAEVRFYELAMMALWMYDGAMNDRDRLESCLRRSAEL